MNSNSENIQYSSKEDCILMLLATGEKTTLGEDIQKVYLTWQNLEFLHRKNFNFYMTSMLDGPSKYLYESLMQAFEIWDDIQNQYGAPGWNVKDSSLNSVMKSMDEELSNLLYAMELVWKMRIKDILTLRKNEMDANVENIKITRASDLNSALEKGENRRGMLEKCPAWIQEQSESGEVITDCSQMNAKMQDILCSCKEEHLESNCESQLRISNPKLRQFQENKNKVQDDNQEAEIKDCDTLFPMAELHETPTPGSFMLANDSDMEYEEEVHVRNLFLSESRDDSDFERQVSPLRSEEED
ncbi:uncharacterized protein LOC118185693 [Stegodyphus dumicola]|uniref:uncharacterized protein LOC118185693 n=1 Tax=Stegodyphus dumicola TaxID=202533 RepID=UPI0015A9A35E|nr:uncharacterized protein LOC118185693 [Stegodyphus dumicola]